MVRYPFSLPDAGAAGAGTAALAAGGPTPTAEPAPDAAGDAAATITAILRSLLAAGDGEMDEALARSLVSVGGLTTVDRCFVGRLHADGVSLTWDFQWCADGVAAIPADELMRSLAPYPWLRERLDAGATVHIEDVAALPMAATREKERWLRHEIRSTLAVPMVDGDRVTGLMAFDAVRSPGRWSRADVSLLETLGQILATARQRCRSERQRAEAHRRLADTIEFLPDATFVIDGDGRVVAWNRALEELTGVPQERMIGRGDHAYAVPFHGEAVPVLIDHFGSASLGVSDKLYDYVEAHGEKLCAECFMPFLKDGQGAFLWITAAPLRDEAGRVVGAIESLRDITARKLAERGLRASEERIRLLNDDLERRILEATSELRGTNEALQASEARYRRIIENLGDTHLFYSHDTGGRFTYVSPSYRRTLGVGDLDELAGRVRRWLRDPRNRQARERTARVARGSREAAFEFRWAPGSEQARILEILAVPVFGADGEVVSIEGVARDVTSERRNARLVREARDRLLEAEKLAALGDLVAGLSHEIATPVGVGVTAASLLESLSAGALRDYRAGSLTRSGLETMLDTTRQTVSTIHANLNRTADLLQNFKQVAVDQSAGLARTFGLRGYLGEIVGSLEPKFRGTGYRVDIDCPEGIVLNCDPGALYRIVSNLVMNTLHHGFDGLLVGRIDIGVHADDRHVVLEYRDDGNGMTAAQLARLYEPFYTTKRGRGGTGLGMHIVYSNVTQVLGGTITCTSKPGRGTRFTIAVPLPAEAAP